MVQRELRLMKDSWWAGVASELEAAADMIWGRSIIISRKSLEAQRKQVHYESLGGTLQRSFQSAIILWCVGSLRDPAAANWYQPCSSSITTWSSLCYKVTNEWQGSRSRLHTTWGVEVWTNSTRTQVRTSLIWREEAVPQEFKDASTELSKATAINSPRLICVTTASGINIYSFIRIFKIIILDIQKRICDT